MISNVRIDVPRSPDRAPCCVFHAKPRAPLVLSWAQNLSSAYEASVGREARALKAFAAADERAHAEEARLSSPRHWHT